MANSSNWVRKPRGNVWGDPPSSSGTGLGKTWGPHPKAPLPNTNPRDNTRSYNDKIKSKPGGPVIGPHPPAPRPRRRNRSDPPEMLPGGGLPGRGNKQYKKLDPGASTVGPPSTRKPVRYTDNPPETLPVDPIGGGSRNGASGSGGNYASNMASDVGRRRGMTEYSNPVHPSSSRRRDS